MATTVRREPTAWPSFAHQLALAEQLYGAEGGGKVAGWLETQIERIGSAAFARLFSDHIDLPGVAPLDYAHRYVRSHAGSLIGGIRFYGHDLNRPFIEVVAHDFGGNDDGAARSKSGWLSALVDVVAHEWSAFRPIHMHLRTPPGADVPQGGHIDTHVFVERYGAMTRPDGRVRLEAFANPNEAMAMVRERFAAMERDEPQLRRNVFSIKPDYLNELHAGDRVHAILPTDRHSVLATESSSGGSPAGLLAIAPGGVDWIKGDEVMEDVIASEHAGHGYAASAQAAFASLPANDQNELLIGTIDVLNVASRRTAERAGRINVMDYLFVDLPSVA